MPGAQAVVSIQREANTASSKLDRVKKHPWHTDPRMRSCVESSDVLLESRRLEFSLDQLFGKISRLIYDHCFRIGTCAIDGVVSRIARNKLKGFNILARHQKP